MVIPKDALRYYEELKAADDIDRAVKKTFKGAMSDPGIKYIGIEHKDIHFPVDLTISRGEIEILGKDDEIQEMTETARTEITIIRAILERSKRKWEFSWNKTKISSAINDESFYNKFEGHVYQIAPGDKLDVDLSIRKRLDKNSNVWEPVGYEITPVWGVKQYKPGTQQSL